MKKILDENSGKEYIVEPEETLFDISRRAKKRNAVAAMVNNELIGLGVVPEDNSSVKFLDFSEKGGKKVYWQHFLGSAWRVVRQVCNLSGSTPLQTGYKPVLRCDAPIR